MIGNKQIFLFLIILKSFSVNCFEQSSHLFINNEIDISSLQPNDIQKAIHSLEASILQKEHRSGCFECFHIIKHIDRSQRQIIFEDESVWKISYWYRNYYDNWAVGDRIKIYINEVLENIDKSENIKASLEKMPSWHLCDTILRNSPCLYNHEKQRQIILQNGGIFVGPNAMLSQWKILDPVVTFCISENQYELWNLKRNEKVSLKLVGNEKESCSPSILHLENRINQQILGQKDAVAILKNALFSYWGGCNNPKNPIGVFLFLGPSGVGKTELAKVLCQELFPSSDYLTRLDMSHFSEPHSVSRLIGSPPGYVSHEEGGQLSNAISRMPHSIVLLDEMEKSHPSIQKFFLPIFDEGYIADAKNRKYPCSEVIFIMTSNTAAVEISDYFHQGYTSEEILQKIEPMLMKVFSPELYNRVTPVLFRPIDKDLMESMVELMLKEIHQKLKTIHNANLIVEKGAKTYLIDRGFHPILGARPLQKLIQQKIVSQISYTVIANSIPENKTIVIDYCSSTDQWKIQWY